MVIVIFITLLAIAIYKCVTIAQRPTSNAKCAYSLGIVLGAMGLISIASAFATSTDSAGKIALASASDRMFLLQTTGVCFLIAIVGAVFAILGLREIDQRRTAEDFAPTPGRGMAIFALVLWTCLFGAPAVVGLVAGIMA
jgi:uncharacterized membrane protein